MTTANRPSTSCRDQKCITEQSGGLIQSNLIQSCSDDGIYINRAAASTILHNTLIDTAGISVRFVESGAEVRDNLVDGFIRSRDGASLHDADNFDTGAARLYIGSHPALDFFADTASMALTSGKRDRLAAMSMLLPAGICAIDPGRRDRPTAPSRISQPVLRRRSRTHRRQSRPRSNRPSR